MGLLSRLANAATGLAQDPDPSFVVVDVETTGLSAGQHRVLSIAAVTLDADGLAQEEFSTLLDPGCDPGPVHIHGLTREVLKGSPVFPDVFTPLARMLQGRVLVAHNAAFDHSFLAAEARRANVELPTTTRLCTLALTRRLDVPSPNYQLGTLAEYWSVPHKNAHNALDDARALVQVFGYTRTLARRMRMPLPFTACEPFAGFISTAIPRVPCPWAFAGPWKPGEALVQGMKAAITGDTSRPREKLAELGTVAGLEMMNNVSRRTSLVICNDRSSGSRKLDACAIHGIPVISEADFESLLENVLPGRPKGAKPTATAKKASLPKPAPAARRRVLVLGGPPEIAVSVRERLADEGAELATNLSMTVTEVVLLEGAESDPRAGKAWERGLSLLGPDLLPYTDGSDQPEHEAVIPGAPDYRNLRRGEVTDLPTDGRWVARISWSAEQVPEDVEVDVLAFRLDADDKASGDEDIVFFNQPASPDSALALTVDGDAEQSVTVDLDLMEPENDRIVIAASLAGDATFAAVGAIELAVENEDTTFARATLDAATTERTLVLAEIYRRGDVWRVRAVGQGYDFALEGLCELYGIEVG